MSALLKTLIAVAASATSVAAYAGDITYYTPGIGACGEPHSEADAVVALSYPDFGNDANPNNAAVCGKWIKITHGGKTARAQVWDKCAACERGDVDVSPSVFSQIYDLNVGRAPVTWEFEDSSSSGQNTVTNTVPDNTVNNVASTVTVTVTVTVTAQPQAWRA